MFTVMESEIIEMVAQGLMTKEIAVIRGRAYETIKNHITQAMNKAGAKTRAQLVAMYLKEQQDA